jgi:hypothetical protein
MRGDALRQIAVHFRMGTYGSVSSVVERLKLLAGDAGLGKRVDRLVSPATKSQEQT